MTAVKDYAEFQRRWTIAPFIVRAWMKHKARWEAMPLFAIAREWGFPTEREATRFMRHA